MIITCRKIKLSELKKLYDKDISVLIPCELESIEKYKTLNNQVYDIDVKQGRKYSNVKHFFKCLDYAIECGILERRLEYQDIYIDDVMKAKLYLQYKSDIEVLRYILKLLFWDLEDYIMPNGDIIKIVCSHSFEKMTEEKFNEGKNKSIAWMSEILEHDIERNVNNEFI